MNSIWKYGNISAWYYQECEYFRIRKLSGGHLGSLVPLEYSARAQPSGRVMKNAGQAEWNLLFLIFDTVADLSNQYKPSRSITEIFKHNKETSSIKNCSKSDEHKEFRMDNQSQIEEPINYYCRS